MPVPQYWDMDEVMPNMSQQLDEWVGDSIYGHQLYGDSFYAGAEAMWEKLKSEGSIRR